jgi:hypothetical protein
MKTFDVQSVGICCKPEKAFAFISAPANLPKWTHAFAKADKQSAVMRTQQGELTINLTVHSSQMTGCIDWQMIMPDGSEAWAYSRVTPGKDESAVYSFVLMAPPVPLKQLEGALKAQMATLSSELQTLKGILENK